MAPQLLREGGNGLSPCLYETVEFPCLHLPTCAAFRKVRFWPATLTVKAFQVGRQVRLLRPVLSALCFLGI